MSIGATSSNSFFSRGVITDGETITYAEGQLSKRGDGKIEVDGTKMAICGKVDLKRYGTLKINDELIYTAYATKTATSDENREKIPSEEIVFKEILTSAGNDWAEALQYSKLLQQNTFHLAHAEVFTKNDYLDSKDLKPLQQSISLKVGQENFKISHEFLAKIKERSDPEEQIPGNTHYAKMKVVISGSRADVVSHPEAIKTQVMHTAEYRTESAARKALYGGYFDYSEDAKSDIS